MEILLMDKILHHLVNNGINYLCRILSINSITGCFRCFCWISCTFASIGCSFTINMYHQKMGEKSQWKTRKQVMMNPWPLRGSGMISSEVRRWNCWMMRMVHGQTQKKLRRHPLYFRVFARLVKSDDRPDWSSNFVSESSGPLLRYTAENLRCNPKIRLSKRNIFFQWLSFKFQFHVKLLRAYMKKHDTKMNFRRFSLNRALPAWCRPYQQRKQVEKNHIDKILKPLNKGNV